MHLYFVTRGVKHMRDLFVTTLQSQFFPWKRKNMKTGKDEVTAVQGALRPVEFWEYVFPEESLPEVMAMLGVNKTSVASANTILGAKGAVLRKMLGCKKIPDIKEIERTRVVSLVGMSLHPLGIKEDERKTKDWGVHGKFHQEML